MSSADSVNGKTSVQDVHYKYHGGSKRERTNEHDVDSQIALEEQDVGDTSSIPPSDEHQVISFGYEDPENPHYFSRGKKVWIVFVGIAAVMNSSIGSSIASGATGPISKYFHNDNQEQLVLPTSIYLVGYVLGPLVFSPLSESYGRRWVMIGTFALYTVFTLGCAVAPNFAALICFRLFAGMGACSPISVVNGIYSDIYADPTTRGRAMIAFMAATMWGPLLGPILGGFISVVSWQWAFWLCLILAGVTWPLMIFCPETHAPTILKRRAQRHRKETGNKHIVSPIELEDKGLKELVTVVLTRPLRMLFFEGIVLCSCLYLSFAYAIFYMFFQAFPIVFTDIYGFNAGEEGLAFVPIGIGSTLGCVMYLYWDNILAKAKKRTPPAPWTRQEEYRRLPLACFGGPFLVISLFWLGWTARPDIHWIVPVIGALPFGIGFLLLFQGLLNYLVDAYEIFAASATAAAATSRSLFGCVLPFAAKPMYDKLGVAWACSTLGFLSLAMCVIPFVFIRFGDELRARSKFCQYLAEKKAEEMERETLRLNSHQGRHFDTEKMA